MSDRDVVIEAIRSAEKPYYVYLLLKPDATPFYVGMGQGERVFEHERHAKRPMNKSHRLNTIRAIWKAGGEVGVWIDSWYDTAALAHSRERELILAIGRRDLGTGPLTNQTAGGDGCPELGPEAIEKMRVAATKNASDPAHRRRISESLKKWNQQHPELVAEYHRRSSETNRTEEVRRKKSQATKRYLMENPELVAAHRRRHAERMRDPEVRAKIRRVAAELHDRNRALANRTAEFKRKRSEVIERCLLMMERLGIVIPKNRTFFRKGRPGWDKVRARLHEFGLELPAGKSSLLVWQDFEHDVWFYLEFGRKYPGS